jgi:hypothetical protein
MGAMPIQGQVIHWDYERRDLDHEKITKSAGRDMKTKEIDA